MAQTIKVGRASNIFTATTSDGLSAPLWKFLETLKANDVISSEEHMWLRGDLGGMSALFTKVTLVFDQGSKHAHRWKAETNGAWEARVQMQREPYNGVVPRDRIAVCVRERVVALREQAVKVSDVQLDHNAYTQLLKEIRTDSLVDIQSAAIKIEGVPVRANSDLDDWTMMLTIAEAI